MIPKRTLLAAGLSLAGLLLVGQAEAQYPAYPYFPGYAYSAPAPTPPSWNYDPYTSGLTPCPQWVPGLTDSCRNLVPSYGQPNYRPRY